MDFISERSLVDISIIFIVVDNVSKSLHFDYAQWIRVMDLIKNGIEPCAISLSRIFTFKVHFNPISDLM